MESQKQFCLSCQDMTDHIVARAYDEDQDPESGVETLICQRCGHSDQEPEIIEDPPGPDLGVCAECGSTEEVYNIIFLKFELPEEFHGKGWGCLMCGLPANGASTVVCNKCFELIRDRKKEITKYKAGYPTENNIRDIGELSKAFDHDLNKHPELSGDPIKIN